MPEDLLEDHAYIYQSGSDKVLKLEQKTFISDYIKYMKT